MGDAPELVRREEHDRFVPLPEDMEDPDGVHIGCSSKDDQTAVSVPLSREALRRNSLLIGKTQMETSYLMKILARRAMEDRDRAPVVLDPQGDTVRVRRGMVPPDRIGEAYTIDFAEEETHSGERPIGLLVDGTVWAMGPTTEERSPIAVGQGEGSRRLGPGDPPTGTIGALAIDE